MIRKDDMLDNVRIASPCRARWSEMEGDDSMRHCALCKKNVYDISSMTREAAEKLLRENSRPLCLRIHRRADGRVLTSDCPVGRMGVRRRLMIAFGTAAVILIGGLARAMSIRRSGETEQEQAEKWPTHLTAMIAEKFGVKQPAVSTPVLLGRVSRPRTSMIMGEMAYIPPKK